MRQVTVYLLLGILVLAVSAQPAIGASLAGSTTSESGTEPIDTTINTVDPAVQNSSGHVKVIVQLGDPELESLRTQTDPQATLKSHAVQTQQPLLRYANSTASVRVIDQFWITNAVLLDVDLNRASLTNLTELRHVKRVHANFNISAQRSVSPSQLSVNEPVTPSVSLSKPAPNATYGLNQINAPSAWTEFDTRGSGTTVAVLDTGVDTRNHTSLSVSADGWKDFVNNRSHPYDNNGHGTHVSGTIAGGQTQTGDHYGVAPDTILVHGKVLDRSGSGSFADILTAMEWTLTHESDVDVLSLSLGTDGYESAFIQPIKNLRSAGVVVVAAAGNHGPQSSSSPGNVYGSLSIGASTPDGTIAEFSSGERIMKNRSWNRTAPDSWPESYTVPDVAAPGVGVNSAAPGGEYRQATGTSMATPHVAGAIALLQSATDSQLLPADIESYLTQTTWKPADAPTKADTRYGTGIVDIHAAITKARGGSPAPQFTTTQSNLSNSTILTNESVVISTKVSNTGNATGTYTGTLTAEGVPLNTTSVRLSPGETTELHFTQSFATHGSYRISINETAIGILQVDRPTNLKIYTTDINTTTAYPGDPITISATISNLGDRGGTFTGEFRSNGEVIHTQAQTISPLDSGTISFTHAFSTPGEYTLTLNGSTIGTISIRERPTFVISSSSITPNPVLRGEPTTISVTIKNRMDTTNRFTGNLRANNSTIATDFVSTPAGESRMLSYTHRFNASGEFALAMNQSPLGVVDVERPATFEFDPLVSDPQNVSVNESLTVSTAVKNTGDRPGRVAGLLQANNMTVDRKSRFLLPDRERTISFTLSFNESGTYRLTYADASPTTVTVTAQNASVNQYRGSDGVVDTAGLRTAIDDWRAGAIDTELLRQVIDAWRRG